MVINPSFALSAPHTTFLSSFSPIFTSQTLSRSAFGCFSVLIIFAILNNSLSEDKFSTLSTSNPIFVSCSKSSFSFTFSFSLLSPAPIFGAPRNRGRAARAWIALEQSFQVALDHWRHQDQQAAAQGCGSQLQPSVIGWSGLRHPQPQPSLNFRMWLRRLFPWWCPCRISS